MRIMLLGNDERVSAPTAQRIGLINEVLPSREELWRRAHELALKIAAKPPMAVQGTVRAVWESQDVPRSAALTLSLKYPLLGNPIAYEQLIQAGVAPSKSYEVR